MGLDLSKLCLFDDQIILFINAFLSLFKRISCAVMLMARERASQSENERDIVNIQRIRT